MEQQNFNNINIHTVKITSIDGSVHDIKDMIIDVNIWENVLEQFLSARLIMVDTLLTFYAEWICIIKVFIKQNTISRP